MLGEALVLRVFGIPLHGTLRSVLGVVEVEEDVGALTPVVSGVAQAFHDLLVQLRLLLVTEVEEGKRKTDMGKAGK